MHVDEKQSLNKGQHQGQAVLSTLRPCANTQVRRRLWRAGRGWQTSTAFGWAWWGRRIGERRSCPSALNVWDLSHRNNLRRKVFWVFFPLSKHVWTGWMQKTLFPMCVRLLCVCICCQGDGCFPFAGWTLMHHSVLLKASEAKRLFGHWQKDGACDSTWAGGVPHCYTTPRQKQNSPLGPDSQPISLFQFPF